MSGRILNTSVISLEHLFLKELVLAPIRLVKFSNSIFDVPHQFSSNNIIMSKIHTHMFMMLCKYDFVYIPRLIGSIDYKKLT